MNIDKNKLSVALEALLQENKKIGSAVITEDIKRIWKEVMTPEVVSNTKKLTFSKGKLIVKLHSAPLRQNLTYRTEEIKLKINDQLNKPQKILDILFK